MWEASPKARFARGGIVQRSETGTEQLAWKLPKAGFTGGGIVQRSETGTNGWSGRGPAVVLRRPLGQNISTAGIKHGDREIFKRSAKSRLS
ncbi:hypothetical protein BY996DRAFT_6484463 [Phakopsora pachyrhizi]|nr:hypothetical protein BY996DRAFT_6484463 [Phakopsora pachyrhizi]